MTQSALSNKAAIITGGGTGIGRACAELFARHGARICITGRRASVLQECADNINGSHGPGTAIACPTDVTSPEQVEDMVDQCHAHFGRIDILVNNAGAYNGGSILEITPDQIDFLMNVNVRGPLLVTRSVAKIMAGQKQGSIINISSTLGSKPAPNTSVYSATKAALNMFTRAWALDLAPHQVRVNCICPAVVDTPIHDPKPGEKGTRRDRLSQMAGIHPLGRIGRPEEIAAAALYFAGDDAAWTTGAILDVDGGVNAG